MMESVFIVIVYQTTGSHSYDIHHVCSTRDKAEECIETLESHGYAWEIWEWKIDSLDVGSFIGSHENVRDFKKRLGVS